MGYTIDAGLCHRCSTSGIIHTITKCAILERFKIPFESMFELVQGKHRQMKREYGEIWAELREQTELSLTRPCFHFRADCGGDEIYICQGCLVEIAGEVGKWRA